MTQTGVQVSLPVTFTGSNLPQLNWLPTQLGSSLVAWFDAAKNITLNGSQVSQWTDRTANAIAVLQATSAQQPNLIASAQNTLPGVQNSLNTSAPMQLSSAAVVAACAFDRGTPFAVAVAMKRGTTTAHSDIVAHVDTLERGWVCGDGTSAVCNTGTNNGAIALAMYNSGSALFAAHGSTVLAAGSSYIAMIQYDGSGAPAGISAVVNKNTETMTVGANTPGSGNFQTAGGRLVMFSANPASATYNSLDTIMEILIVNRLLTSGEQTLVDSYLNNKYAIHA